MTRKTLKNAKHWIIVSTWGNGPLRGAGEVPERGSGFYRNHMAMPLVPCQIKQTESQTEIIIPTDRTLSPT